MSSKRAQRRKACTGKARHDSQADATEAARVQTAGRFWMHAYPCPFCAGWHIGHPTARQRRAARAAVVAKRRAVR
jgi:hypothetical protein